MGGSMKGSMGMPLVSHGNPDNGQRIAKQVCAACHSVDGNSTQAAFPKLAGQKESYLYRQLRDFASGVRKNDVMAGIVAGLSDSAMQDSAAWFSRQAVRSVATTDPQLAEVGRRLFAQGDPDRRIPACAMCHADEGNMGRRANFPLLAGQHPEYVEAQIDALKSGARTQAMMMPMIASRLSDADVKAVAAYLANVK